MSTLGPLAPPHTADLVEHLRHGVETISAWMAEYGPDAPHPALAVSNDDLRRAHDDLLRRLRDNYPFFHGRYVGQMLKPPHPAAIVGYVSAMLINPNNHALDGGPATARLEKEVIAQLAGMLRFDPTPGQQLGHLTSSGTIANLEALFIAREEHPGKGIAHSAGAHYTHARMAHVLGVPSHAVPVDGQGRMDVVALSELLAGGEIGTVVATLGTTGLGVLDPLPEIVDVCQQHGVRVHVDAAYGGFFATIADDAPDGVASAPFDALASVDSVVIDPHKHGLQPYGCGAVLFRNPEVARHYLHDSPYTYFTSDELHLGEISLECSRAGAAAAALWLTLQVLPPTSEGIGEGLRAGRRAALDWTSRLDNSEVAAPFQRPELDIVSYVPLPQAGLGSLPTMSAVDALSGHVLHAGMQLPPADALHVATYTVTAHDLQDRGLPIVADVERGRILRSVCMKPSTEHAMDGIHATLERLIREAR